MDERVRVDGGCKSGQSSMVLSCRQHCALLVRGKEQRERGKMKPGPTTEKQAEAIPPLQTQSVVSRMSHHLGIATSQSCAASPEERGLEDVERDIHCR